ncbi:hypothetical protein OAA12_02390 [Akkermansiaceae bacterium]|nr:hypothetical protein [Akkermansiaceae bacterium]
MNRAKEDAQQDQQEGSPHGMTEHHSSGLTFGKPTRDGEGQSHPD